MLQLNIGGLGAPAQFMPALPGPTRMPWPNRPPTSTVFPSGAAQAVTCGYGYRMNQGVCMSDGCITGKSQCVVVDSYGRTCSYDQMGAFASKTGSMLCGPAPVLPPPPQTPTVPAPPNVQPNTPAVVDVSPNPGTQVVATLPTDQAVVDNGDGTYSIVGRSFPKWALALGGLAALSIIIALIVRR